MTREQVQPARQQRRAYWLKTLHQWHWISAALCLLGMLVFSFTGITLNHASQIQSKPRVSKIERPLPDSLLQYLAKLPREREGPLPKTITDWVSEEMSVDIAGRTAEWSKTDIYVPMPRPGGDAWLSIDLNDGLIEYENTDRGVISWLNDLHKGRNTGPVWNGFIDVLAAAILVFCITGFFLLKLHSGQRVLTWPMVGLGVVLPILIILLFIH